VGALGRWFEEEGIPTTQISLVREHTEAIQPPRALWVPFIFAEVGLKGVGSINWVGLFAPAKTPRAIIGKLHAAIVAILEEPGLRETYAKRLVPLAVSASPAEFNAFVQTEAKRWERIVKENNVRLD
jgi:tripartite-type tricarboxylate transporter receptor subunit TctC